MRQLPARSLYIGRKNGLETLKHYTRLKSVYVEPGGVESVFR